ncbi:hypothetical protein BHM03_00021290 [Ensete ventricosum]|uniref:Glucose-6-phosphate 1-epimerase n=1 Tax=Ensete ventricosum TaxID=4639 RepID=A0A445MFZ7_ENSVE|nr:hypothetical protein BHM03_00021290 [Ensete ventricosum]
MADFGDDEYKHMLCVEAAAIEKPITLKPGEEWKGRLELSTVPSSYRSGQLDPQRAMNPMGDRRCGEVVKVCFSSSSPSLFPLLFLISLSIDRRWSKSTVDSRFRRHHTVVGGPCTGTYRLVWGLTGRKENLEL